MAEVEDLPADPPAKVPEACAHLPEALRRLYPELEPIYRWVKPDWDDAGWVDEFVATPGLERYIERERIPRAWRATDSQAAWTDLRPLTLNFWLQLQASKPPQETHA